MPFWGVLKSEELRKYSLKQADAMLLWWFIKFCSSSKMEKLSEKGNNFWVDYDYAAENLFTSERNIRDSFDRLCGKYRGQLLNESLQYPLVKYTIQTSKGKRNYFGFNPEETRDLLIWDKLPHKVNDFMREVLNNYTLPRSNSKSLKKCKPVNINIEIINIITTIIKIRVKGPKTPLIFTNRFPENGQNYTNRIVNAAKTIQAIYDGLFRQIYRVSPEFIDKNKDLIKEESWTAISQVKGDWTGVLSLILKAIRHYRQWFWSENEPESKDWLPRDLSSWLYDPYSQSSLFLACIDCDPYPVEEKNADQIADQIYETIPGKVQVIANKLYQSNWDPVSYWRRIKDIVEWYGAAKPLINSIPNIGYWLDGGLSEWFRRYVAWLHDLAGEGLYLTNIGVNCQTWKSWLKFAVKEHSIPLKEIMSVKIK